MATTNFVDQTTVIEADWLNEVDALVHDVFSGATTDADARTNLGVAIGTDVQAYDAGLADIAGLSVTDGNIIVGDGANWVAESGATARTSLSAQEDVITTRGDIVRGSSGAAAERLAVGTDGQILVSDGTDIAWGSQFTEMSSTDISTGATSYTVGSIPSYVTRIFIGINGVSLSGTDDFLFQIGDAGGIEATGYLGGEGYVASGGQAANAVTTAVGIIHGEAVATADYNITLTKVLDSSNTWLISVVGFADATNDFFVISAATKSLSGTLTQFKLGTNGSDTFDAGTMYVVYE